MTADHYRDCVCLIHGNKYSWNYVDKLYSMLSRHSSQPIRLHVMTESSRFVPSPLHKIALDPWPGIEGPRSAWWYKLQLFNIEKLSDPMVYFDLDTVILNNIDWIWQGDSGRFWAVRDFQYLWKPAAEHVNSSIMRWNPNRYYWIWEDFNRHSIATITKQYRGDQEYLDDVLPRSHLSFFDQEKIMSWRWQISDGGWDFRNRQARSPGNSVIPKQTDILICHGDPKPHTIKSSVINKHWI